MTQVVLLLPLAAHPSLPAPHSFAFSNPGLPHPTRADLPPCALPPQRSR